ncbi:flagellar hook-length control protein FliK [Pseudomonas daroniae]|uniref:Flagellar hook-length control protein FliK n=1 Tax=Phytopseudomonas daroniae TaxID=2487519 RepID=A0A4Q9QQJ4_9GAMM|nr:MULTISPECIES: flagellar hook-length control protein FliK [Pseudomonas]TBU81977.1 flagellar hook-length control protein FliK [Pseudomonas daroniae]TBU84685.1 flagellar hook-length control protein FliK [Pseudomonas sp. FRB 228]TBU92279.1 flagellar hook-length control protein FliK [Pseudomonas daroniae]
MPVAPDLLLTPTTVAKPKAPAANNAQSTAEPRKQEASSFSQVYAKERQAKAVERQDNAARNARDSKADPQRNVSSSTPTSDQAPAVAESGKDLPADPASEDGAVDPLLMLGLFEPQPVVVEVDPELQAQAAAVSTSLIGSAPASMTEASFDPEIDALNQLPAVRLALDIGAQEKVAEQGATSAQVFASAMAAMGMKSTAVDVEGESAELPLFELSTEALEALKESSADTAPEQFVSKLSALSQVIGQQTSQAARVPVVPGQPVAMQQTGWGEGVVDKVMWMSSQNLKSAEIQLDPAELGRLDVRISLNQDQTQISFASAHPGVREALESQMHRLREMFTQQGMNLADVNVSDQSQGRAWQGQENDGRGRGDRPADDGTAGTGEEERVIGSVELRDPGQGAGRGMVDYYA